MKDYEKRISYPDLGIEGIIYGSCPVQAEGKVSGFPFYFHARHDEWSFSISEKMEIEPIELQTVEDGNKYGFFIEEQYGEIDGEDAGYMELDEAEKLILKCYEEYILNKKK